MFVVGSNCSGSRETVIPIGKYSIMEQNASLITLTILLKRWTDVGDKTDPPLLPPQSPGSMLQLSGVEKPLIRQWCPSSRSCISWPEDIL